MRVRINDLCCGHAMCTATAPDLFEVPDDDFRARVVQEVVPPELENAAWEASRACPEMAVEILED